MTFAASAGHIIAVVLMALFIVVAMGSECIPSSRKFERDCEQQ